MQPDVIGMVRVSTEDQKLHGVSLAAQEERIRGYCLAHELNLVEIVRDEGVSGTIAPEKRPGMRRALEMLRAGEASGLVVLRIDRLTRSLLDLLNLVNTIRKEGWALHSVSEHVDTSSPMGEFFLTIMGAVAQLERKMISTRVVEALAEKRRKGAKLGGAPYGWRKVDEHGLGVDELGHGKLTEHAMVEAEQAIIFEVREMWTLGKLSQSTIAALMNQRGRPAPKGAKWSRRSVQCILATPEVS